MEPGGSGAGFTDLAATVLAGEEARQVKQSAARTRVVFPDELLPGVGSAPMSLREGLTTGGATMFILLTALNSLDELAEATLSVLAPDIRDTFGISDGAIVFIATAANMFFVLGAVPMGWLADRVRRVPLVGVASVAFGVFLALCGLAVNAFMLFWARFFAGIAKANTIPVHGSLLADTYPIPVRARMSALNDMVGRGIGVASPVLVAGIAAAAGGTEGWRWTYVTLSIPVAVLGFFVFRLREPPRGQWEQQDVLGESLDEVDPAPITMEAAFARLHRIRTIRQVMVAFSAMGFSLFSNGVLANLYLEDEFGLSALERGMAESAGGIVTVAALPFVGRRFDELYRRDPARALALIGAFLLPTAVFTPIQFVMPNVALFVILWVPSLVLTYSAFAMVRPVLQAVVPYRLRGLGAAYSTLFIFCFGGIGGALLSSLFVEAWGPRTAVIAIGVPSTLVGGLILMNGARFIRNDLSLVVEELLEEQDEQNRRRATPSERPLLQLANIDFSYGSVQVLFDIDLEVRRGETLALLGTNGAGKSTLLRVISGLAVPERGVVRFDGRTITYSSPEQRTAMGIRQLPGGKGVFPALSVEQNLIVGADRRGRPRSEVTAAIERSLGLFPGLASRLDQPAGSLSGGQQQMLALARVLQHDPELLIIDELSLGLAPVIVQELLGVLDRLSDAGTTMIIVEQSLNVALAIAERAVFLEKGQVRFEGSATELHQRQDLARAVFFGTEGG